MGEEIYFNDLPCGPRTYQSLFTSFPSVGDVNYVYLTLAFKEIRNPLTEQGLREYESVCHSHSVIPYSLEERVNVRENELIKGRPNNPVRKNRWSASLKRADHIPPEFYKKSGKAEGERETTRIIC